MISIIIVNWNSFDVTKNCLKSIDKWAPRGTEVILIDNHSTTIERGLKLSHHKLKCIYNSKNLGFGKASNQGAKLAKGDILFFINPDTQLIDDSLSKMESYLRRYSEIGAVGPKLVDQQGRNTNSGYYQKSLNLGQLLFFYSRLVRYFGNNKFLRSKYLDKQLYKNGQYVESLPGAALMAKREVFSDINGFDEKFFLWFEDVDLCLRIRQKGLKLAYLSDTKIVHIGGLTFSRWQDDNSKRSQMLKSLDFYVSKNKSALFRLEYLAIFGLIERGLPWLKQKLSFR